jgi:N-acetylglucosamine kinase-like BadF-type ATPase
MILVAESGSTKTQWCVVYPDRIEHLENTSGINPVFLTGEEIEGIIRPVSAGIDVASIDAVYFFGAGCNSIASKEKIGKAIFSVLQPPEIIIDSDLIAACLALAGEKPAMIGILGTGSNSCLWNGSEVEEKNPSLGFILGDEGSGVSIGKQLVADFLKKQMPVDVQLKFSETYDVSVENVIERVYQLPLPNRYLAGFAPFIEKNIENTYCRELLIGQFERFITRNILSYSNAYTIEIHFCGSIASIHAELLIQVCSRYGLTVGKIVKEPINDLADFLSRKIYQIE